MHSFCLTLEDIRWRQVCLLRLQMLDMLRENLNTQAAQVLTDEMLSPEANYRCSACRLSEIDVGVLESLELLRPFGMDFQKPLYLLEDLSAATVRKIGAAKNHMKLELAAEGVFTWMPLVSDFGHIADQLTPGVKLSVAGDLQVNEWNGNKKPQLLISDIRSDEWQLFDLRGDA